MLGAALLGAAVLLATAGCTAKPPGTFAPAGGSPSAATGPAPGPSAASPAAYVMPPFGRNVHIQMTSWLPREAAEARAVTVDKDYELAFLYAEYKGGRAQGWAGYVSPVMRAAVQQALRATDVTTESFTGTVSYFDLSVIPDPLVKGDLDVSSCFDNAGSVNTSLASGAVIPDQASPDTHYVRIGDELRRDSAGQWQVVSGLPAVYYPQAPTCKPGGQGA